MKADVQQLLKKGDDYFNNKQYTSPEGSNAYAFYQKALKTDPSNEHAMKRIRDILEVHLNVFEQNVNEYGRLLKDETKGDVKKDMMDVLVKMINNLKEGKKICNEFPKQDTDTEKMIKVFQDNIDKYEKIYCCYQEMSENAVDKKEKLCCD